MVSNSHFVTVQPFLDPNQSLFNKDTYFSQVPIIIFDEQHM